MARIATIDKKDDLAPEHQPIYDAILKSRGAVGGPWPSSPPFWFPWCSAGPMAGSSPA